MKTQLTPHLVDLTFDAALKSFWRRNKLSLFLGALQIQDLPEWLPNETKRDYLSRVFELLQKTEQRRKIIELARSLSEQTAFPDLENWEDSENKIATAKSAVDTLRRYLSKQNTQITSEKQKQEARRKFHKSQAQTRASQQTLQSLENKLCDLVSEKGSPSAGKGFEKWFYKLMDFSEITSRRPYKTGGREIDGSITIGDTTYLVECKFTTNQTGAPDIDIFRSKVETKADNTMGVFVSICGYSPVAKQEASGKKTPLLLLDHNHLYHVLRGISGFQDVIERIRRNASQTGEAYLPVTKF